jgi:hypothetical protein
MAFHRVAEKPLTAWIADFSGRTDKPEGCVAEMHVTGGDPQVSIWFTQRDGEVGCRYPYDEEAVLRDCTIRGARVAASGAPDNAAIEVLVAMTKRLHYTLLAPTKGRWLFTRLDVSRLLQQNDREAMSVTMIGTPRETLTRSEITVGGGPLGSIFFSAGAV